MVADAVADADVAPPAVVLVEDDDVAVDQEGRQHRGAVAPAEAVLVVEEVVRQGQGLAAVDEDAEGVAGEVACPAAHWWVSVWGRFWAVELGKELLVKAWYRSLRHSRGYKKLVWVPVQDFVYTWCCSNDEFQTDAVKAHAAGARQSSSRYGTFR